MNNELRCLHYFYKQNIINKNIKGISTLTLNKDIVPVTNLDKFYWEDQYKNKNQSHGYLNQRHQIYKNIYYHWKIPQFNIISETLNIYNIL